MIAAFISSLGEHLLHQTFIQGNHVAVTIQRVKIMCIICRAKSYRFSLHNFIRNNQENNILFGPKLKIKTKKTKTKSKNTTAKKEIKKKSKKTVPKISDSASHEEEVFIEFENEIICDESAGDPYICDENVQDSVFNREEHQTANAQKRTIGSSVTSKCSGSKTPISHKFVTEKTLADVPVIDGLLNASLYPQRLSVEDHLHTFMTHVDKFSLRSLPSVTAILNKTQSELSRFYLERWKREMTEELGEEGFKNYQEGMLRNGINLHANIQQFLSGVTDIQVQPNVEGYWKSLDGVLSKLGDVLACEHAVSHTQLKYKGKFDCVAVYRDCLCVIDWKTSQKPKPLLSNTFDSPIQVAAYVGAINSSTQLEYGPVTNAAVVIAYPWGEPAHVHLMDQKVCEQYWNKWLQRLHQYWKMLSVERNIL